MQAVRLGGRAALQADKHGGSLAGSRAEQRGTNASSMVGPSVEGFQGSGSKLREYQELWLQVTNATRM